MKRQPVLVRCSCSDYYFTWSWSNLINQIQFGGRFKPYVRKTKTHAPRNPDPRKYWGLCKHLAQFASMLQNNGLSLQYMNYYQLLGIDSRASKNDIKKAYRKKAVEFHPDINKSPEASDVFKKIKIAYDNLYDDTLRMLYDRSLVNIINSRNIYTQVYKKDTYEAKPAPVIIEPRNVVVKGIEFLDIKRKPDSFVFNSC